MSKLNIRLEKDWLGYQLLYIDDVAIDEFRFGYVEMDFFNCISGEWQEKVMKVVSTSFNEETELLLIKLGIMEKIIDYENKIEVKEVYDMLFKKLQNGVEITII